MDDRSFIEVIHGGHDAVFDFLFGCDRSGAGWAGKLGEEALDQVRPRASITRETPGLCRGGSRGLTFPAVALRRNVDASTTHTRGSFAMG